MLEKIWDFLKEKFTRTKEIEVVTTVDKDNKTDTVETLEKGDYRITVTESSVMEWYEYTYKEKLLKIRFNSGSIYEYYLVPFEEFERFHYAESKGSFVHQVLTPKYKYKRK